MNDRELLATLARELSEIRESIKVAEDVKHRLLHLTDAIDRLRNEVKEMSTDLSAELAGLVSGVTDLTNGVAALGPAIDKEIQQVIDAINGGHDAVAALEAARSTITGVTGNITALASSVQAEVAKLSADDPQTPPEPPPA